jgi:hypothetical protein
MPACPVGRPRLYNPEIAKMNFTFFDNKSHIILGKYYE